MNAPRPCNKYGLCPPPDVRRRLYLSAQPQLGHAPPFFNCRNRSPTARLFLFGLHLLKGPLAIGPRSRRPKLSNSLVSSYPRVNRLGSARLCNATADLGHHAEPSDDAW